MFNKGQTAFLIALFILIITIYENHSYFQAKARPPLIETENTIQPKSPPKHQNIVKSVKVPILIYHYVEYVKDKNDLMRASLNIQPHIFERQIVTLKEAGYTFITPRDLGSLFGTDTGYDKKYVIVSFDDGYEDFYTDVFPIIKKHEVRAVNYLVFNFINKPNYMNGCQIEEIIESDLVEIGAHTLNHRALPHLKGARREIFESKELLEKRFGIEVRAFAYPQGAYNDEIERLVEEAEFTSAVTLELGNILNKDTFFKLPRIRPGKMTGSKLIDYIENLK